MEFELSKPQKMLQDSVREFLTRHCDFEKVRELMETDTAHDAELWEGLTDQGWVALTLPWVRSPCRDRFSPTRGRPS
jgi:alkylation response protein AidB-like acyl-CoA dehydrogenase